MRSMVMAILLLLPVATTYAAEVDFRSQMQSCMPQGSQALFDMSQVPKERQTKQSINCTGLFGKRQECDGQTNGRVLQAPFAARLQASGGYNVCGKATHFADQHGQATASGLVANNNILEMMSTRLHPLGTVVQACDGTNGKCAFFAIVDVGPGQLDGPQIFDFLTQGAEYFGFYRSGSHPNLCATTIAVMEGGRQGVKDDAVAALEVARCLNGKGLGGVYDSGSLQSVDARGPYLQNDSGGSGLSIGQQLLQSVGLSAVQPAYPSQGAFPSGGASSGTGGVGSPSEGTINPPGSSSSEPGPAIATLVVQNSSVIRGRYVTVSWSSLGMRADQQCRLTLTFPNGTETNIIDGNGGSEPVLISLSSPNGTATFKLRYTSLSNQTIEKTATISIQ